MEKVFFAELHGVLFLAGKNHGLKLFSKGGLTMENDRAEKELVVRYNGKTQRVPHSNVVTYESDKDGAKEVQQDAPRRPGRPVRAQASTPQDHVFADGPGKARD